MIAMKISIQSHVNRQRILSTVRFNLRHDGFSGAGAVFVTVRCLDPLEKGEVCSARDLVLSFVERRGCRWKGMMWKPQGKCLNSQLSLS